MKNLRILDFRIKHSIITIIHQNLSMIFHLSDYTILGTKLIS